MEEERTTSITPHVADVPSELIQHIQTLLPAKEDIPNELIPRTCVLSKSWLHAWSTIPAPQLRIAENSNEILEIYGVPSLCVLDYHDMSQDTFKMDPLGSVRELVLFRVLIDNTFSDMAISKFPFLESLTLKLINCRLETLDITCVSLKRLTLDLFDKRQFNIQVYAPKLLYFCYKGFKMTSLLFPSKTPEHIKLLLKFKKSNPIDRSFFLKMREALYLASNFDIARKTKGLVPLKIDLEDLRRRVPFPARNVQ
nr:hypothetical protein [Tanacetum cinerariifolium]